MGSDKIQKVTSEFNLPLTTSDFLQGKIDCQGVGNNSILVIVSGYSRSISGYFFHTFILVEQSKAFFVSNSAFRILPDLTQQIPEIPIETKLQIEQPQQIVEEVVLQPEPAKELVSEPEPSEPIEVSEVSNVQPEVVESLEVQEIEEVEPEVETQPESDPTSELEGSSGAKSYSDIVKKIKEGSSVQNTKPKYQKPVVKKIETPIPSEPVTGSSAPVTHVSSSKQPEFAIFVRELPETISESDVISAFSQFGEVLKIDRVKARNYGFIKFQTNEGKQNALAYGQPVDIKGVSIKIEERTPGGKSIVKNGKDKVKSTKDTDRKGKTNGSSKTSKSQEK